MRFTLFASGGAGKDGCKVGCDLAMMFALCLKVLYIACVVCPSDLQWRRQLSSHLSSRSRVVCTEFEDILHRRYWRDCVSTSTEMQTGLHVSAHVYCSSLDLLITLRLTICSCMCDQVARTSCGYVAVQ